MHTCEAQVSLAWGDLTSSVDRKTRAITGFSDIFLYRSGLAAMRRTVFPARKNTAQHALLPALPLWEEEVNLPPSFPSYLSEQPEVAIGNSSLEPSLDSVQPLTFRFLSGNSAWVLLVA